MNNMLSLVLPLFLHQFLTKLLLVSVCLPACKLIIIVLRFTNDVIIIAWVILRLWKQNRISKADEHRVNVYILMKRGKIFNMKFIDINVLIFVTFFLLLLHYFCWRTPFARWQHRFDNIHFHSIRTNFIFYYCWMLTKWK